MADTKKVAKVRLLDKDGKGTNDSSLVTDVQIVFEDGSTSLIPSDQFFDESNGFVSNGAQVIKGKEIEVPSFGTFTNAPNNNQSNNNQSNNNQSKSNSNKTQYDVKDWSLKDAATEKGYYHIEPGEDYIWDKTNVGSQSPTKEPGKWKWDDESGFIRPSNITYGQGALDDFKRRHGDKIEADYKSASDRDWETTLVLSHI